MCNKYKRAGVLGALLCAVFIFSGCDMVDTVKEYFSKSDKKTAEVMPTPVKAEPVMKADTLASVGKWTISKKEFEERLEALKEVVPDFDSSNMEARKLVLDELVRQQLLVEDARRSGLLKDKDIRAAVEEFERTLIVRETAKRLTESIEVSDEEIRNFYEEKKDILIESAEWRVRQIVVDTQLKASEVQTEILKGGDFAELAKVHSTAADASKGGDMGFVTDVPFPEMATALIPLKDGEVSSVFKGPDGFYLVKLEEKKGGKQIPFDKIEEDIRNNRMLLKQQQVILDHIEKLQQEIPVEINEDNIE